MSDFDIRSLTVAEADTYAKLAGIELMDAFALFEEEKLPSRPAAALLFIIERRRGNPVKWDEIMAQPIIDVFQTLGTLMAPSEPTADDAGDSEPAGEEVGKASSTRKRKSSRASA